MKFGFDTTEQIKGEIANAVEDAKQKGIVEPVKEIGQYIYDKITGSSESDMVRKKAPVRKAKGGFVKAADGIAKRGKTRGRMV